MNIEVKFFETLDSTNTYCKTHSSLLPGSYLVCAGEQSAGRGRLNRRWFSPPKGGLYASWLVDLQLLNAFDLSRVMGLAALKTLREIAPEVKCYLKWPNDIFVGQYKLAGMLSETVSGPGNLPARLVCGIGINLNLDAEALATIDLPATSLKIAAGSDFDAKKTAEKLAKNLEECYSIYSNNQERLYPDWKSENKILHKIVTVKELSGEYRALVQDITPDGELQLLLEADGSTRRVNCADVRLARSSFEDDAFLN